MKPNSQVPIEERWKADSGFSILPPKENADGGPGSGNHGHKGVPGQVGGSAPSTSGPISKSSFQKGSGHFEVTGDVKDMYLTKPARTRIEGAIKTVKTANDLKKYLENQGIKLETSYEPLKKAMNREIPSIKEQADYVIAAIEQYKDLGGLKALKAVHIYDHDIDAQAQYSYRAKGEGEVPDEGHLYISYMADGAQIMHEFAHAYADSTKPDGMDVVEWSAKLNQEAGLSKDVKAYFGANSDAKEAERFANAMGYAIADGDGPDGRLAFAANVANIVKNSNGKSAGTSSENLAYKSLVPENSYTKTSAEYKNALDAYRTAIRKGDEAKDKYMAAKNAMESESKPKPESEWDDNDIFEDLIGHRPMIYTEKGKQLKAEYDKYFKESMDYSHEMTVAGDKLRAIKQKEHDKQSKDIHLEHTKDATSNDYEGFTTKTTGTSYYDDYLNGEKNGGHIAEMSPKEYLQRCAYQIFDSATIESTLAALDEKNVKKYAEQMKSGTKFDMPYLNFASGQQEGRHRAAAAMQLGIDKIPVLVVGERFAKYDGGPGSGNFGHAGVPGKVGGSAPSSLNAAVSEKVKSSIKRMTDDDAEGFLEDWLDIHGSERRTIVKSGNIQSEIEKRLSDLDSKRSELMPLVYESAAQREKINKIAPTLIEEKIENNYSVSETGEILEHVTGHEEGAEITNFDVPYATIHNHPGLDVTFSTTDIEAFANNEKMTSMTVQAKGTVYSIKKTGERAEKDIADLYSDYYGIYTSSRSDEKNFYKMRVWLYLNAHKYGVLYSEIEDSRTDGGPGSGNFNHEGRPGEVGGSAPKGSADSTASVQKLSKLKDGFSNLTNKQQFAFLKRTGSISVSDLYALETKINSGDNSVAEDLKRYSKSYFDSVESSKTVKSLDCDTRDKVSAMSQDDARAWIDKSVHRNFNESEMWWVNWGSSAQKVAIDLGMNETPQVVSKEDFNKYVEESGAAVCYRGVRYAGSMSGSNMIYQMAYDKQKNYFGNGIYGDGLYFSTDQSVADSYSDGSGAVAKCAIRPDAKVVEFRSADIEDARKKYGTSDYAIAAMCAGYDAIKVQVSGSEDYYVVLNRAAMVMEDPVDSLANMAIKASERNAAKKSSS